MAVDVRKGLRKFSPYLIKAQEDNVNEADTLLRIVKVFEEVFGYDPMTEITREMQIKDKYADIGIKIDNVIRLLVEVKAASVILRDRHIEQAEGYASHGNYRWVLLTNGVMWNLYHLTFEEGIERERVFSTVISPENIDNAASYLNLLHRQSIKNNLLEDYWKKQAALSPESIGKALFTEDVLLCMRRVIRKNEGILIDQEDLANAIHDMFSDKARERIGPLHIHRRRKIRNDKSSIPDTNINVSQENEIKTKPEEIDELS